MNRAHMVPILRIALQQNQQKQQLTNWHQYCISIIVPTMGFVGILYSQCRNSLQSVSEFFTVSVGILYSGKAVDNFPGACG